LLRWVLIAEISTKVTFLTYLVENHNLCKSSSFPLETNMLRMLLTAILLASTPMLTVSAEQPDPPQGANTQHRYEFDLSALYMTRRTHGSHPLVSDPISSQEIFNTRDYSNVWGPGVEAGLSFDAGALDLEFRGFRLDEDHRETGTTQSGVFRLETIVPVFVPAIAGDTTTADFDSHTYGLEANLHKTYKTGLDFYAGARWIRIDDDLSIVQNTLSPTSENISAKNNLIGAQIGTAIDWVALSDGGMPSGLIFNTNIAVGLFRNKTDADVDLSTGVLTLATSSSDSHRSTVVDANIEVGYQVSSNFKLIAGYNALWISGVATAPNQLRGANFITNTLDLDRSKVFYHGGSLKALWTF